MSIYINRDLPNDEYNAAVGANNPSASNVFATISDLLTLGGILHGVASGTNAYTVTIPSVTSYADGDTYVVRFTNGNDDDSTIDINGLGVKTLVKQPNVQVTGGDILAGQEIIIVYDGTTFQCIETAPNQLFAFVTNDDSVTINKGEPVYTFGATGNRMTVKLAFNTSDATSARTIGVVYSTSIAPNQTGFIIINGVVSGLNTSMYAPGDQLYLGATAGTLTNVKPYAPNHLVYVGLVERANAGNGQIYVKVQNGYELDELHDVDLISNPPIDGQVLTYNAITNLWVPTSIPGATPSGTQLLTGGASWSGTGMIFNVSALTYTIDGNYYSSVAQNVTLAAGDPSNPRFDAIVVDAAGTVSVITGTPSVNPIVPSIPGTQVLVQYVLVAAGAVTPSITNEFVYTDGSTPNWIPGSNLLTVFNPLSTTPTPFQGTECTYITAVSANTSRFLKYTKPSGSILRSSFPFLSFRIQVLPGSSGRGMNVRLYNGLTYINAVSAASWGYSSTAVGVWQLVVIPLSAFGNNAITTVTEIRFLPQGTVGVATPFAFDDIKFQSGYGPQTNTATIDILDNGTVIGSTAKLNFIDGINTTVTVNNDIPNTKIDVRVESPFGPFGIADASGLYIYFSDITTAMANAVAGDTIEMFSDFIDNGVTVSLKPGVKINGNGHTYTLDDTGTANAFQVDSTYGSGEFILTNLNVRRINGTSTNTAENNVIYLAISAAELTVNSCNFYGDYKVLTAPTTAGGFIIKGGNYYSINSRAINIQTTTGPGGRISNVHAESTNDLAIFANRSFVYNSIALGGQGGIGSIAQTQVTNCYVEGGAGTGIGAAVVDNSKATGDTAGIQAGTVRNSYGFSSTGSGISGIIINNCNGSSSSGQGIVGGSISNSTAVSDTSYALILDGGAGTVYNTKMISNQVVYSDFFVTGSSCVFFNCYFQCLDTTSTYAITEVYSNFKEFHNCIFESASDVFAITGITAVTVKYSGNRYKNITVPIDTSNVTQGLTTPTEDSFGNLLI